jgi:hypothetical protein
MPRTWLWPDHRISKSESAALREEHNRLVNSHAALLKALRIAQAALDEDPGLETPIGHTISAAIAQADPPPIYEGNLRVRMMDGSSPDPGYWATAKVLVASAAQANVTEQDEQP